MGHGQGHGEGHGQGHGEGHGGDTGTNVAVGGALTVVFVVVMCTFGIPLLIAGCIMIATGFGTIYKVGLAIVIIAVILTVAAAILIVLICTGVLGSKPASQPGRVMPIAVPQAQVVNYYTNQPAVPPNGQQQYYSNVNSSGQEVPLAPPPPYEARYGGEQGLKY